MRKVERAGTLMRKVERAGTLMRKVERASSVDLTWPYLGAAPHNPIRAMLAKKIFLASVRNLPLLVELSTDASSRRSQGVFGSDAYPTLRIEDPKQFFARLGRYGALGFGESYLLGAWEVGESSCQEPDRSNELVTWLATYASALESRESMVPQWLRRSWRRSLPISERNSATDARRNVQAHYDLDSRLFRLFLDRSMTYSSAWFERDDDLTAAQMRKIDSILDLANVDVNSTLLDVGFGFGSLALRAASERSAKVTGITLSREQLNYAVSSAEQLGMQSQATFLLEDYRQHCGVYDSIVCVEMIEAVGAEYWTEFFLSMDRLLAPDGSFALQVITFPHHRMIASRGSYSWVDRYIFPGGQFPSLREINCIVKDATSLEIVQARRLSDSYERTLREWRHRFIRALDDVRGLGFDETFIRLWILYFAYFEAGFRSRFCDVWQIGMRKRRRRRV